MAKTRKSKGLRSKKRASKKVTPKKKTAAKIAGRKRLLEKTTCRLWCPQCGRHINGRISADDCDNAARDHNIDNPGHKARCECEQ